MYDLKMRQKTAGMNSRREVQAQTGEIYQGGLEFAFA